MPHTYKYPRPAVTVDAVVVAWRGAALEVLLIQRAATPFKSRWALPGGFVEIDEDLAAAARRELAEETGLELPHMEQLQAFGAPKRDPRDRVISVAHLGFVRRDECAVRAASDARKVGWFPLATPPRLAFDHAEILAVTRRRLREKIRLEPFGRELLPAKFQLSGLQRLYEAVLGRELDPRRFRKEVLGLGHLVETGVRGRGGAIRAARLFRFNAAAYRRLQMFGIEFLL